MNAGTLIHRHQQMMRIICGDELWLLACSQFKLFLGMFFTGPPFGLLGHVHAPLMYQEMSHVKVCFAKLSPSVTTASQHSL